MLASCVGRKLYSRPSDSGLRPDAVPRPSVGVSHDLLFHSCGADLRQGRICSGSYRIGLITAEKRMAVGVFEFRAR